MVMTCNVVVKKGSELDLVSQDWKTLLAVCEIFFETEESELTFWWKASWCWKSDWRWWFCKTWLSIDDDDKMLSEGGGGGGATRWLLGFPSSSFFMSSSPPLRLTASSVPKEAAMTADESWGLYPPPPGCDVVTVDSKEWCCCLGPNFGWTRTCGRKKSHTDYMYIYNLSFSSVRHNFSGFHHLLFGENQRGYVSSSLAF